MENGKTILFAPVPNYSHTSPTVEVAKGLKRSGFQVVYVTTRELTPWLNKMGFPTVEVEVGEGGGGGYLLSDEEGELGVRESVGKVRALVDHLRPDGVFIDVQLSHYGVGIDRNLVTVCMFHTCRDAESLGTYPLRQKQFSILRFIPNWFSWVVLEHLPRAIKNITNPRRKEALFRRLIRTSGQEFGCSSLNEAMIKYDDFVLGPRSLSSKVLDGDRYFGFCENSEDVFAANDCDCLSGSKCDRIYIYCSFGTRADRYPDAFRVFKEIIEFAESTNVYRFVVQGGCYYEDLKALKSGNVILREKVDQKKIIDRVDAVVCHGGYGTVKECVRRMVPMVVVPFELDQFASGRLVEEKGIGRMVDGASFCRVKIANIFEGMFSEGENPMKENLKRINQIDDKSEFDAALNRLISNYQNI